MRSSVVSHQSDFGRIAGTGAQVVAKAHPQSSRGPSGRAGETILIVDDDEMVRRFIRTVLEHCGYRVLDAGTIEELDYLRAHQKGAIDLLLADVVMPDLSGPEVSELLCSQYPDLKVLYMSGHTDDCLLGHGVRVGSRTFLQKPFSPTMLAQRVREILDYTRDPLTSAEPGGR